MSRRCGNCYNLISECVCHRIERDQARYKRRNPYRKQYSVGDGEYNPRAYTRRKYKKKSDKQTTDSLSKKSNQNLQPIGSFYTYWNQRAKALKRITSKRQNTVQNRTRKEILAELTFLFRDGNTYISGSKTYEAKERLKQLGCRWDKKNKAWYAIGKRLDPEDY